MHLGLTGTRNGATQEQLDFLAKWFSYAHGLHHGACQGVDEQGHDLAVGYNFPITIHPPVVEKLIMDKAKWTQRDCIYVRSPKAYLTRDRDIVDAADKLLALPEGPHRAHSGTWYTINYAIMTGVPVVICYPDGSTEGGDPWTTV